MSISGILESVVSLSDKFFFLAEKDNNFTTSWVTVMGFVRESMSIPLIGRNYPTLTQTHLPNEFHLLMILPIMMPSRF
jgi:hypothetical protein